MMLTLVTLSHQKSRNIFSANVHLRVHISFRSPAENTRNDRAGAGAGAISVNWKLESAWLGLREADTPSTLAAGE